MIALREHFPKFSPEEYFIWEEQQLERHEYMDGEVYVMSGGTIDHGDIAGNFLALLKAHLRGSGYKTLNSDCRVSIVGASKYVYPNVSVTCDDSLPETLRERGNTFKLYRRNPSLQEYVLVSVDTIEIELFRKTETGDWRIINYQAGDTIELNSVNLICPIERVYEDIVFSELNDEELI